MSNKVDANFSLEWSGEGVHLIAKLVKAGEKSGFAEKTFIPASDLQQPGLEQRVFLEKDGIFHGFEIDSGEARLEEQFTVLAQRVMTRALYEGYLRPNQDASH